MAIDIDRLTKRYAKGTAATPALSELSLTVHRGEALALLGANGAGKSTLIRILSTLLRPDSGRATIGGFDVVKDATGVRETIGVALQEASVYPAGRVQHVLTLHARLHGLDRLTATRRSSEVIELLGLGQVTDRKVHRLSGGMRRRLDLGLALIHMPPVLLLDEPTAGLDPIARYEFWNELTRLRDGGTCVLLATQSTEEAEHLTERVVVLANGCLWLDDTPAVALREMSSDAHAA
jgi:ABC-type multidrug transport system ATPase subunit